MKPEHKKIGKYIMLTGKKVTQLKHSAVYLGIDSESKKKVLIKVIPKEEYQSNDILMNSLNFQLQVMNVLKNQNILKHIQLIMTDNNYYLILQEPKGHSFKRIIERQGPLKQRQIKAYLRKMTSTFSTLSKSNLIHGNINSKSVLIDHGFIRLGYPSYLKTVQIMKTSICQQGQSTFQNELEKQKEYAYLPPELLASGMVSIKHDIWSLGVVVYQALYGFLPWNIVKCENSLEMASLILNQKIMFPKNVKLSKQMKHFLIHCLEVDPIKRFSWDEVLSHTVFTNDIQTFEQINTDEEEVSEQQRNSLQLKSQSF